MSNIHSPSANVKVVVGGHNLSANGNSASCDCRGYTRAMVILVGTTAAASGFSAKLQECATAGGSYTDVTSPSSGAFSSVAASQSNNLQQMDVDLSHRLEFLEVNLNSVSGTVGVDVTFLLFNGSGLPITTSQIVV